MVYLVLAELTSRDEYGPLRSLAIVCVSTVRYTASTVNTDVRGTVRVIIGRVSSREPNTDGRDCSISVQCCRHAKAYQRSEGVVIWTGRTEHDRNRRARRARRHRRSVRYSLFVFRVRVPVRSRSPRRGRAAGRAAAARHDRSVSRALEKLSLRSVARVFVYLEHRSSAAQQS